MHKDIQEALENYLKRLQKSYDRYGPNAKSIVVEANAIGRCYDLLGNHTSAIHYFNLSAQACLSNISHLNLSLTARPDNEGNEFFECALALWWAGGAQAQDYFQRALEAYQKGHQSEVESIKIHCWMRSLYCLLFLEDFDAALHTGLIAHSLQKQSSTPQPDSFVTEAILEVAEKCQPGDKNAYDEVMKILEQCFKREKIKLWWSNQPPHVSVYEFVKRKRAIAESLPVSPVRFGPRVS
jgi:tetratricopeptide (TPR) repeat protein